MDDRFNTIAGWALFAGIIALGSSIVSDKIFHAERPENMGYAIEGVVEEGAGGADAGPSIATLLATADIAAGEKVYAKCAACHTVNQGGANGIGPNLYGIMGQAHGHLPNFAYTAALKAVPGNWTFEAMDAWLKSPRTYASGTKMTFAGLGKPEDRANVIAYLNAQGSNLPLPTPEATPAAEPAEEGANAAAPVADNAAAPASAE